MDNSLVTQFQKKALSVLETAKAMTILTDEAFAVGGEFLRGLKTYSKELDATFDPTIKAQRLALEEARKAKATHAEPIMEAERLVKGKLAAYQRVLEDRQAEEARKAREAAQKSAEDKKVNQAASLEQEGRTQEANAVLAAPTQVNAPKNGNGVKLDGVVFKEKWNAEVLDLKTLVLWVAEGKAPITFLKADESAIRTFAQATKGMVPVPGVRFSSEKVVASRSA